MSRHLRLHVVYFWLSCFCVFSASRKSEAVDDDAAIRRRFFLETPSIVTISDKANDALACGGAVISEHVVITSASCISDLKNQTRTVEVLLDAFLSHRSNAFPETRLIVDVLTHPSHTESNAEGFDVALLVLDDVAEDSAPIYRGPLPVGTKLVTSGAAAVAIRVLRSEVVNASACLEADDAFDVASMICLSGEIPCEGDEGGPVFHESTGQLVAVVTRSSTTCKDSSSRIGVCPLQTPELQDWIDSSIESIEMHAHSVDGDRISEPPSVLASGPGHDELDDDDPETLNDLSLFDA